MAEEVKEKEKTTQIINGKEYPIPRGFIETKGAKDFALFLKENGTEREFFLVQTFNNRFSFTQMPIFSFSEKEFTQVAEGKKLVEGIIAFKIANLNLLQGVVKTDYYLNEVEQKKIDFELMTKLFPEITYDIFQKYLDFVNEIKESGASKVSSIANFLLLDSEQFAKLSEEEKAKAKEDFIKISYQIYRTDFQHNAKVKATINLISSYQDQMTKILRENTEISSIDVNLLLNKKLKIILKEIDYKKYFKYGKQRVLTDVRFTELSENYDMSEASGTLILKYFANWVEETVTTNSNTGKIITDNMNGTYTEETYKNGTTETEVKVIKTETGNGTGNGTNTGTGTGANTGTGNGTNTGNNSSNPLIVLVGQSKQVYIKYKVKKGDEILKLENKLGLKHGTPFYRLEKGKYNPIKDRDYILEKETIYYKTATPKDNAILTPYAQAIVQRQCTVKDINLEQGGKCYVLQNKKYAPIPEDITLYQNNKIYFTKTGSEDKTRETTFNKELFDKDYNVGNKKVYVFEPYTFKKGDTVWDLENDLKVKVYKTAKKLATNSKNFFTKAEVKKIPIGRTVYLTTPGYEDKQNNTLESKK